jgi:hypothetical protein
MKARFRLLLAALLALSALGAHAQRAFDAAELEALLAPIALYPDPLVSQILDASRFPEQVEKAAAWSRANPQLSGDAALATVQGTPWDPSVKALVAYPELLARMVESPQWLRDLGEAYATYGPNVMATIQDLRARAQGSGYLQSNDQQQVYDQGGAIVVQPAYPNVAYAPYYDPFVVFGGWTWTAYRPVVWRPWIPHPVFVTRVVVARPVRWYIHPHRASPVFHRPPAVHGGPTVRPYRPVPEARRPPFVHSGGKPFVHSGQTPFIHGAAPRFRAEPRSFAGGGRPDGGARGHGGGHGGRR